MTRDAPFVGVDVDDIARRHLFHITFDGEGAGIFHGVEEDRGNLAADAHTAIALVRNVGNVVADVPQHGVGGGLARRTGAQYVADQRNREAFLLQFGNLCGGVGDAFPRHLVHGQCVQWDVRAGPCILSRRKVIGIGFAWHLVDTDRQDFRQLGLVDEPLGISPGLQQRLGVAIARLGTLFHIVERVEHEQGVGKLFRCQRGKCRVIQKLYQRHDVVTTQHGAKQSHCQGLVDDGGGGTAVGDCGQEARLYVSRFVHACWYAIGNQIEDEGFFPFGRVLQQFDECGNLLSIQWFRNNSLRGTFGDMFTVRF